MRTSDGIGPASGSVVAITDTILFDDPQLMIRRRLQQGRNENLEQREQRHLVLRAGPKYHNSCMANWRIRMNIREVHVQGNKHPMARANVLCEESICGARELLVGNRVCFESCAVQDCCKLRR